MKQIESRANPLFRQLFRLQGAAGRRGEPALIDGLHLCQSWLDVGRKPVHAIFDESRLDNPALRALIERLPESLCVSMPPGLLAGLASVETGQGVIFVVEPPAEEMPARIKESVVLLDRIQDPGNVGTILRTCAAAGIQRVVAAKGTAALWSPKVLRSGQGAHFVLHLHEQADLPALASRLDVPLVATALDGSVDLFSTELPDRCAWVFGHEGQGVEPALLAKAALRVRIDHERAAVESLNVAIASAICLFEHRRQRLRRG